MGVVDLRGDVLSLVRALVAEGVEAVGGGVETAAVLCGGKQEEITEGDE